MAQRQRKITPTNNHDKFRIDRFLIQPIIGVYDEAGEKVDERTQEQATTLFGIAQLREYPIKILAAVKEMNEGNE